MIVASLLECRRPIGFKEANPTGLRREVIGGHPEPLHGISPGCLEDRDPCALCLELFVGAFVDRHLAAEISKEQRCGEPAPTADPPELLELAAGSPGGLLRCRQAWAALPEGLAARLLDVAAAAQPLQALALARDLAEALDAEQQLWLLGWWQLALWRRQAPVAQLQRLERLRSQLRAYVQPRLAWEVALLELAGI